VASVEAFPPLVSRTKEGIHIFRNGLTAYANLGRADGH